MPLRRLTCTKLYDVFQLMCQLSQVKTFSGGGDTNAENKPFTDRRQSGYQPMQQQQHQQQPRRPLDQVTCYKVRYAFIVAVLHLHSLYFGFWLEQYQSAHYHLANRRMAPKKVVNDISSLVSLSGITFSSAVIVIISRFQMQVVLDNLNMVCLFCFVHALVAKYRPLLYFWNSGLYIGLTSV